MSGITRRTRALGLMLLLGLAACSGDEVVTPTRYLERPNAIDFFCVGPVTADGTAISALPAWACTDLDPDYTRRKVFGLVTNSARSQIAMLNVSSGALVDLDRANPAYGFVPVGEAPVQVRVTEDGCAGYVVNHGTCDLTRVNVNRVLHGAGYVVVPGSSSGTPVSRLALRTAAGRLLVRPLGLALRPEYQGGLPPLQACAGLSGHRAFVTLPGCGLVAEVDLDTGRILQSLRLTAAGAELAGASPSCPSECLDRAGDAVPTAPEAEFRPGPVLVTWDGMRLVVGDTTQPRLLIADIDLATGQLAHPRVVTLAAETEGVRQVRQSPYTGEPNDWHFLYAVSRSGVVHVLDGDWEEQCEVNPDPADPFFPADPVADPTWEARRGCLRLSDPTTPARAPTVTTPGITLPGNRRAVDVAFVQLTHDAYVDSSLTSLDPGYLGGTFAYVLSEDGLTYLVNVDETFPTELDPGAPEAPLDFRRGDGVHALLSHQLRSATNTLPDEAGRPRVTDDLQQTLVLDGNALSESDRARADQVGLIPDDVRPLVDVLDPYRVRTETWSLAYQGVLPAASRSTGQVVREDLSGQGAGLAELRDPAISFCPAGVRDDDVAVLLGCASDDDCGPGYTCHRSFVQAVGTSGICLADDGGAPLQQACEGLASTRREYRILRATSDALILVPRVATDATPCAAGDLAAYCCDADGEVAAVNEAGACLAGPEPDRVITLDLGGGRTRLASCFEGLVRYQVRLADGQYLLSGTMSGLKVAGVPDEADGGHCVDDPEVNPLAYARVPRTEAPYRSAVLSFALDLAAGEAPLLPRYGYVISFGIEAGFEPRAVDVSARLPAAIEVAPDGYVYVVDQGYDNLQGGLQGQVLRLLPGDIALDTSFVVR